MNGQEDTQPIGAPSTLPSDGGLISANRLAEAVKRRWLQGQSPDVVAVLKEHPDLRRYRSVVLDLACQEYQHRLAQGESLDVEEFSGRFPSMQKSLHMLLEVQRLLDHDPQFCVGPEASPWPELDDDYLGFCLLAELGRGTFGRVFLASEPALGNRLVALKVAPHGDEEAEIIGKLRHPNVVPVYSTQEDRETGLTAVCMPYLGRTTLCDVLDHAFADGRLPTGAKVILEAIQDLGEASDLRETQTADRILSDGTYVDGVLHLTAQLADALAHAHARGVCHRDLKPSNVLLTLEGRPLLLDFNLSSDQQRNARRVGGTLPYMAPEQLRQYLLPGEAEGTDEFGPQSDIYALGVILYELLSGRHPFGDVAWNQPLEQVADSLLERQEQRPVPVVQRNRHVSRSLDRLVCQCLAFDPADRPASAADLARALRGELAPLPRARRWSRRHPLWTACLAVFLMVALLGGMAGIALRDPASVRQYHQAKEAFEQEKYAAALESLEEAVRLAPDFREARILLARTYQQISLWDKAADELRAVERIAPSGRIVAAIGYCLQKGKSNLLAEPYYEKAIHQGYCSADVLTNLGFCYSARSKWRDAEAILKEAVEKDPNLRAPHFTLLVTYYNAAGQLSDKLWIGGEQIQPMYLPRDAYFHARKVVELGPPSKDAYQLAGTIMFRAEEVGLRHWEVKNPDLADHPQEADRRLGREYLRQAIAHGSDPRSIPLLVTFAESTPVEEQKQWKELMALRPGNKPSVRCDRTVNPLEYTAPTTIATASSIAGGSRPSLVSR